MHNFDYIRSLISHCSPLLAYNGGIVFNTSVTLARNIAGLPFSIRTDATQRHYIMMHVFNALQEANLPYMQQIPLQGLSSVLRNILFERNFLAQHLTDNLHASALLMTEDESVNILINGEEHLLIQVVQEGHEIETVLNKLKEVDHEISKELIFATDPRWGFLTSDPACVGSGMKIRIRLHLPGLVLSRKISHIIKGAKKMNMQMNAFIGEHSGRVTGALYELSNMSTLGEVEEEVKQRILSTVEAIIQAETVARQTLFNEEYYSLLNQISRAYGSMKYAYTVSETEMFDALSILWFGVELNLFSSLTMQDINLLLTQGQEAHLRVANESFIDDVQINIVRAKLIRDYLKSKIH